MKRKISIILVGVVAVATAFAAISNKPQKMSDLMSKNIEALTRNEESNSYCIDSSSDSCTLYLDLGSGPEPITADQRTKRYF